MVSNPLQNRWISFGCENAFIGTGSSFQTGPSSIIPCTFQRQSCVQLGREAAVLGLEVPNVLGAENASAARCFEQCSGCDHPTFTLWVTAFVLMLSSHKCLCLVVLGLCAVGGLFSASCVVCSNVTVQTLYFYAVWKTKMEFKFFHHQDYIRSLCNSSPHIFFPRNFIWNSWKSPF